MQITPIITYLREQLTSWSSRIDGAAEYEAIEDKSRLAIPSMFVMYGGSTATLISYSTFEQELDERLRIMVVLDNKSDRTGKSAQDQVHTVRDALFGALLNYQNDEDAHTLQFVEDRMIEMDKARYFHLFEFKQIKRLEPDDGVALTLDNFNTFYADWEAEETNPTEHPDAQDHLEDIY